MLYADELRYSYSLYERNVENFEKTILQINSVLSTSLMIESKIFNILYDSDGNLRETEIKEKIKRLEKEEKDNLKLKENFKKINRYRLAKAYTEKEIQEYKKIEDASIRIVCEHLAKTRLKIAHEQNLLTTQEKMLKNEKSNEYYIGLVSKDRNLISLFKEAFSNYIANDIIKGIRENLLNQYKIINPFIEETTCLSKGAYEITKGKIKDLLIYVRQNHKKEVVSSITQEAFDKFIKLEKETQKKQYIKIIDKYIKDLTKNSLEHPNVDNVYKPIILAGDILKELRWFDFE